MRISFIRPRPMLPESFAGTQITLHWLCRRLRANGHEVALAALTEKGPEEGVSFDLQCGYPVIRSRDLILAARMALTRLKPEVLVLTQVGDWILHLPQAIREFPLVIYEHEVSKGLDWLPDDLRAGTVYAANSSVSAAHLAKTYNVSATIVPPIFGLENYADIRRQGENVLHVSLTLRKGFDIALGIARSRPKAKFIVLETWTKNEATTQKMRDAVGAVPNITLLPNQQGLRDIMPRVKLLLMPSRGQESWGRTVSEAQICGIPVLGSNRGHLPKTIGAGGMTLDPDEPIENWLNAFDKIMDDPSAYEDLSRKASDHGREILAQIEPTYKKFENLLASAIAGHRA